MYLSDELPLSAHEGDAVLHRQVQSPLDGLLQREIKVEPAEKESLCNFKLLPPPPPPGCLYCLFLPLVKLRVEVPLLGGRPPLGGTLLVGQQDERDVRVRAVLGAGCQGSEGGKRSQGQNVLGTEGSG